MTLKKNVAERAFLYGGVGAGIARSDFVEVNSKWDDAGAWITGKINFKAKWRFLMQAFADQLIFPTLTEDDCPMFVPILVPEGKRNELRRYLIQRDIYCPVHWPVSPYHKLQKGPETDLYDNELSLVCDQRYTERDMLRMVEAIHEFWKEN